MKRLLLSLILVGGFISAKHATDGAECQIMFKNDTATPVQIANPHKSKQSFVVTPGKEQDIYPMAAEWWKHFVPKTLHVYVQSKDQPGSYELAYQVKVHHCRQGGTINLSMSQVEEDAGKKGNEDFTITREHGPKPRKEHRERKHHDKHKYVKKEKKVVEEKSN